MEGFQPLSATFDLRPVRIEPGIRFVRRFMAILSLIGFSAVAAVTIEWQSDHAPKSLWEVTAVIGVGLGLGIFGVLMWFAFGPGPQRDGDWPRVGVVTLRRSRSHAPGLDEARVATEALRVPVNFAMGRSASEIAVRHHSAYAVSQPTYP